jgi:guanylate kinase
VKKIFFVFSAPSGAGKTTLVRFLLRCFPSFRFSVSCTSRPLRGKEADGVDYHFVSSDKFRELIAEDYFVEWEEVYPHQFYGTPRQPVLDCLKTKSVLLLDLDVKGGLEFKRKYPEQTLAIFVEISSPEVLENRLRGRDTDSETKIQARLAQAVLEMKLAREFDVVLVNDELEMAKKNLLSLMEHNGYFL